MSEEKDAEVVALRRPRGRPFGTPGAADPKVTGRMGGLKAAEKRAQQAQSTRERLQALSVQAIDYLEEMLKKKPGEGYAKVDRDRLEVVRDVLDRVIGRQAVNVEVDATGSDLGHEIIVSLAAEDSETA